MSTILFAWELGDGLGHLVNFRPLVVGLMARGHRVVVALRDLSRARQVFPGDVLLVQAPFKIRAAKDAGEIYTFAHVLRNVGFGDPSELATMVDAWNYLIQLVQPQVIVCEHSPTALVAARGGAASTVIVGNGFFCPPDDVPLPNLRPWINIDSADQLRDEEIILANINRVLADQRRPQLDRISQLYAQADDRFLLTFRELEHYPSRAPATYWGCWAGHWGAPPVWPHGPGPRVFAYLKPCPVLPELFATLRSLGACVLGCVDGFSDEMHARLASERVKLQSAPVHLIQAARECDLAVLNGNHGTTAALLLAGKPILQIPIFLEQALNMRASVQAGAALGVSPAGCDPLRQRLTAIMEEPCYAAAAREFAGRYSSFNADASIAAIVSRIEQLASDCNGLY